MFKSLLINLKASGYDIKTAPQALAKLGGIIKGRGGWEVCYLDEQIYGIEGIKSVIERNKFDFIGISAQIGTNESLWGILDYLQEIGITDSVFIGNILSTYAYSSVIKKYPWVYCCIGRGEQTIWEICEQIENKCISIHELHNIAYSDQQQVRITEPCYPCQQTECYSDWGGLFRDNPIEEYEEFWLESSHGCPRKTNGKGCVYCAILPDGERRKWIQRDLDCFKHDLQELVSRGVQHIKFSDEEFLANSATRIEQIIEIIEKTNKKLAEQNCQKVTFDFSARVDDIIRLEPTGLLQKLKSEGISQIYLGLESGNDDQLFRIGKGVTAEDNIKAVQILKGIGIRIAGGWIMFDPLMLDPREILQNADFLEKCNLVPHSVTDDFVTSTTGRMRVLEGAPLVQRLRERGLLGPLKENLIEYDFEYLNPVIGRIVEQLCEWEHSIDRGIIYRVKSIVSILGDKDSLTDKESRVASAYFQMKQLDLEACKELARRALSADDLEGVCVSEDLYCKRNMITEELVAALKDLNTKKYSLWLIPDDDSSKYLQDVIDKHNEEKFVPHITILGEIIGEEKELSSILDEIQLHDGPEMLYFDGVSFSTNMWQDVFLRIRPTAELLRLNLQLKEKYHAPQDFYVPHLSLTYGDRPVEERERMAQSLEVELNAFQIKEIVLAEVGDEISKFKIVYRRKIPVC